MDAVLEAEAARERVSDVERKQAELEATRSELERKAEELEAEAMALASANVDAVELVMEKEKTPGSTVSDG